MAPRPAARPEETSGLGAFFVVSCLVTWGCSAPAVLAWMDRSEPAAWAMGLAGLSAFGPTLAAVAVTARRGQIRSVFGPWRVKAIWLVVALFTPMVLQVLAVLIDTALGGSPEAWVHLPTEPQRIAALVFFSLGEEFGWRGFAHPRMVARYGPVLGPFLLGCVWAMWHAMFLISPETGEFDLAGSYLLLVLPTYSIIYGWMMRRGGGSVAIAIALHAGAHLDNANRIPSTDVRLRVITLLVAFVAAALAARSLRRRHTAALP